MCHCLTWAHVCGHLTCAHIVVNLGTSWIFLVAGKSATMWTIDERTGTVLLCHSLLAGRSHSTASLSSHQTIAAPILLPSV